MMTQSQSDDPQQFDLSHQIMGGFTWVT
jgi:hypothetical protein